MNPTLCFGQQPCGFFPKRFLVAKINTARSLQKKLGSDAKIVFFYHDSDADYRETITVFRDRVTNAEVRLNFTQENKLQKKFSPLYLKKVPDGWKGEILKQLPRFIAAPYSPSPLEGEGAPPPSGADEGEQNLIDIFKSVDEKFVADFCLQIYRKMGLLDGIKIIRSSDKKFREATAEIKNGFADVEYQGEIVRAKIENDRLALHEGGGKYTYLPKPAKISKSQISAGADERFLWMNSVIHCTHYIYGEGEKDYLKFADFPEVKFIEREKIDNPSMAFI